jgi:RNA polymerase sigma factor (sigma-70 family)
MATASAQAILRHIRALVSTQQVEQLPDQQLLQRYTSQHEEAAFETLVRRHGPLVLGVCRRVLHNLHDAEDAFQATFLILARKADSIHKQQSLGSWLYQVAYHAAFKAKVRDENRAKRERQVLQREAADPLAEVTGRELFTVLDDELQRLPERWRAPLVLCYLQGKACNEAARSLGWSLRTFKRRLSQARERLRGRLGRRGFAVPVALLTAGLTPTARAAVPVRLTATTIQTALGGMTQAAAPVAALVTGGLHAMNMTRMKLLTALLLILSLLGAGLGLLTHQALAQKGPGDTPPVAGTAKGKDQAPAEQKEPGKKEDLIVAGKVVNADDKPIPGADVAVIVRAAGDKRGESKHEVLVQGKTDKDGQFRLVKEGAAQRQFYQMDLLARAKGYGLGWHPMRGNSVGGYLYALSASGARFGDAPRPKLPKKGDPLTITLTAEQELKGRFLDLQGLAAANVKCRVIGVQPVRKDEGVRITATDTLSRQLGFLGFEFAEELSAKDWKWWPHLITTDKEGRFKLSGFGENVEVVLLVQDERFALQYVDLQTGSKGEVKEVSSSLVPPRIIEGKVIYEDTKKPVAEASLTISSFETNRRPFRYRRNTTLSIRTDDQGRFRVNPYLGDRINLQIWPKEGEPYLPLTQTINWTKGTVKKTVDIALPHGILLNGKVTEKDSDKAVAGVQVSFHPRGEGNPIRRADLLGGRSLLTTTGDDGTFKLVVPAGPGHLLCLAPGNDFIRKTISSEELDKGKPGGDRKYYHGIVPLDLKVEDSPKKMAIPLQRGVTLRGKVFGPDGKAVKKAVLFASGELLTPDPQQVRTIIQPGSGNTLRGLPLDDGTFVLPGCDPEKSYRVLIVDDPGWPEGKDGKPAIRDLKLPALPSPVSFDTTVRFSSLLRDIPGRSGAVAEISAKQAGGKAIGIKLQPCGKAEVSFAQGNIAKVNPWLELIVTPKEGKLQPEWTVLGAPRANIAGQMLLTPDKEGRVRIAGLIPGATYRIRSFDERNFGVATYELEFTAESGKTLKLVALPVGK